MANHLQTVPRNQLACCFANDIWYCICWFVFIIQPAQKRKIIYFEPFLDQSVWPAQSDRVVLQQTSDLQLLTAGARRVAETRGHTRRNVLHRNMFNIVWSEFNAPCWTATSKVKMCFDSDDTFIRLFLRSFVFIHSILLSLGLVTTSKGHW